MMHESTTVFAERDVMESLAYYRDKLGFDLAFEYGKPTFYVGLCRAKSPCTWSPPRRHAPARNGAVSIFIDDVDALHAELVKRGAKILKSRRTTIMACATSTLPTWTAT